jgi:hypothetical protein
MTTHQAKQKRPTEVDRFSERAPEGIRTPNLLIRSQMLYPLSYGRIAC